MEVLSFLAILWYLKKRQNWRSDILKRMHLLMLIWRAIGQVIWIVLVMTTGSMEFMERYLDMFRIISALLKRFSGEFFSLNSENSKPFSWNSSSDFLWHSFCVSLSFSNRRYVSRDVVSLTGDLDTYKNGPFGDQSCKAQKQGGVNRRDRNYAQWAYKNLLAGTSEDVSDYYGYKELKTSHGGVESLDVGTFNHRNCIGELAREGEVFSKLGMTPDLCFDFALLNFSRQSLELVTMLRRCLARTVEWQVCSRIKFQKVLLRIDLTRATIPPSSRFRTDNTFPQNFNLLKSFNLCFLCTFCFGSHEHSSLVTLFFSNPFIIRESVFEWNVLHPFELNTRSPLKINQFGEI